MHKSFLLSVSVAALSAAASAANPPAVGLTALGSMERILQHETPFGTEAVEIAAARNEVESFQVVVAAKGENLRVTSVVLPKLVGEKGAEIPAECIRLYREESVRVRMSSSRAELPPGLYPDALVPFLSRETGKPIERYARRKVDGKMVVTGYQMYALPFDVFAGQNQPLWIDVHVPKGVPAGVYRGEVRVTTDKGKATLPVALTVWDFDLPDGPTHCNHFGGFSGVAPFFGVKPGSDEFARIEERYCEALTEHRLNPPIPRRLLPAVNGDGSLSVDTNRHAALRAFVEKLHVTDFQIPSTSFARPPRSVTNDVRKSVSPEQRAKALRYYRDYYRYLKENGWADRAYVYLFDEPNSAADYEHVQVLGEIVHEAVPELKCLVVEQTYPHDRAWPDIDPAVDIWCPLWGFIDRETINEKLKQGDAVWSYTALVQRAPKYHPAYAEVGDKDPPYWHIDRPLISYRVPTWINRQYDITGLLYWSTGGMHVPSPWHDPSFRMQFNGSGSLFYPGTPCGIRGPVASMRLKNIRDGMEDYEYFALLERRAGAAAVRKVVDRIAPTWWGWARDPKALSAARGELAAAILAR